MTRQPTIDALIQHLRNEGKHVDVLINNAGLNTHPTHTPASVKQTLDVNYRGTLHVTNSHSLCVTPTNTKSHPTDVPSHPPPPQQKGPNSKPLLRSLDPLKIQSTDPIALPKPLNDALRSREHSHRLRVRSRQLPRIRPRLQRPRPKLQREQIVRQRPDRRAGAREQGACYQLLLSGVGGHGYGGHYGEAAEDAGGWREDPG